ncbi:hypothetical protein BG61_27570 [Caballeronia glathei]|uniref:Uncharacterized protein n=1 Tax=Caballeronia glathei TaxID=60547 RepID=A0A069PS74_9BURK|nr:hypothetical protein BG61_27570 [Caballeronia glathei]
MVSPDLTGRTRHGRKAEDVDAFSSHERKEGYSPKTGSSLSRGAQFGKARVVDHEQGYVDMRIASLSRPPRFDNLPARVRALR